MIHLNSPQIAAQLALGLDPAEDTGLRTRTRFREALEANNMAPFRLGQVIFHTRLPTAAAINVMQHFNGTAMPWVEAEQDAEVFEGFHRAQQLDLFHRRSADFEDACEELDQRGTGIYFDMLQSGVNPVEAHHAKTLGVPTKLTIAGTVADFWELYQTVAPASRRAHPSASDFARAAWVDITALYPLMAAAFEEAAR
jgi:hypothetical protein